MSVCEEERAEAERRGEWWDGESGGLMRAEGSGDTRAEGVRRREGTTDLELATEEYWTELSLSLGLKSSPALDE